MTREEPTLIPGVLLALRGGHGVLIEGPSGSGKSDAALGLLERGHTLVADDAVALERRRGTLRGRCPGPARGLLHLRDVGVIDATELYGPEAVAAAAPITACIRLQPRAGDDRPEHLLRGRRDVRYLRGVALPRVTLTGGVSRPLPALIEAAVVSEPCSTHRLQQITGNREAAA